jgi:hypothetical protein
VRGLLRLKRAAWLRPLVRCDPILIRAGLRSVIQWLLMPSAYLPAVRGLDHPAPSGRVRLNRPVGTGQVKRAPAEV